MIDWDHDPRVRAIIVVAIVALAAAWVWLIREMRKVSAERKRYK